jgi:hypothetical protein
MKKIALLLVLISIITSCQKSKIASKIVDKEWLLGQWENNSTIGDLSETWIKKNDSLYLGESYFIKGKDTLHSEQIKLVQKGEELLYISTIQGQNNDKAISFKHNVLVEKQLVFENLKNDYPQKIIYSLLPNNTLEIEISGIQQGNPSSTKYSLKKTK